MVCIQYQQAKHYIISFVGGKEGDFRSTQVVQSPSTQDSPIGDPVDHESTEEKMWNKNCKFNYFIT